MLRNLFILLVLFSTQATAKFIEKGECALVVASRPSLPAAIAEAKNYNRYSMTAKTLIYQTENGWFAIVSQIMDNEGASGAMYALKANKLIPQDSFCSNGEKFTQRFSASGKQIPKTSQEKRILRLGANDKLVNMSRADCLIVVASRKSISEVHRFLENSLRPKMAKISSYYELVLLANNGWYAVSIGSVKERDFNSIKSRLRNAIPSDSFCVDQLNGFSKVVSRREVTDFRDKRIATGIAAGGLILKGLGHLYAEAVKPPPGAERCRHLYSGYLAFYNRSSGGTLTSYAGYTFSSQIHGFEYAIISTQPSNGTAEARSTKSNTVFTLECKKLT